MQQRIVQLSARPGHRGRECVNHKRFRETSAGAGADGAAAATIETTVANRVQLEPCRQVGTAIQRLHRRCHTSTRGRSRCSPRKDGRRNLPGDPWRIEIHAHGGAVERHARRHGHTRDLLHRSALCGHDFDGVSGIGSSAADHAGKRLCRCNDIRTERSEFGGRLGKGEKPPSVRTSTPVVLNTGVWRPRRSGIARSPSLNRRSALP